MLNLTSKAVMVVSGKQLQPRQRNVSHETCRPSWSGIDFLLRSRRPFIDMLIALDLFDSHCSLMEGNLGEPIVKLTPLGWTSIDPFHDYSGYEVNHANVVLSL